MKRSLRSLLLLLVTMLVPMLLNSCYFNSAGHLFDKASYRAGTNMGDLQPGHYVYSDGSNSYVELPRYNASMPVQTQFGIGMQEGHMNLPRFEPEGLGETEIICIPNDYAAYLTGKAAGPTQPSFMTRVKADPFLIKAGCQATPVVRTPEDARCYFRHKSPYAALWYTAGAFEWLCVDLPVTCVENCLMLCGGFLVLLAG